MPQILRAIAGLPFGAMFSVGTRVSIGRAPDNDVQLIDAGVSRRHAKLEVDHEGAVVLVDLSSRAGTSVDGTSVERVLLRHGAVITIGHFGLRFEEVPPTEPVRPPPPRKAGFDTLRVTGRFERWPRGTPAVTVVASASAPSVLPPITPIMPVMPIMVDEPPVTAASPGALVRAIHDLRQSVVGEVASHGEGATRLRPDRSSRLLLTERAPGRRRHPRFPCPIQGWVGRRDGTRVATSPVDVRDVGAGGAQVSWRGGAMDLDGPVWLVVDLEEDEDAPVIVFRTRVAWVAPRARAAGLQFVGVATRGIDALELIRSSASP